MGILLRVFVWGEFFQLNGANIGMRDTQTFRSPVGQFLLGARHRLLLLLICGFLIDLAEAVDKSAAITKLTVEPASIQLRGSNRQQQILVTATLEDVRPH